MKTDSTSSVSIDTWGPNLWGAMHALSFSHPIECEDGCNKRAGMFKFLESLKSVIPCQECRSEYSQWFDENIKTPNSPLLSGRDVLASAIVDLHNQVNLRNGKREYTYEEVKKRYLSSPGSCPNIQLDNTQKILTALVLITVVGLVIGYAVHLSRKNKR